MTIAATPPKPEDLKSILDKHRGTRGDLIATLEDVQERYGYLPQDALRFVAEHTGRSLADVYGVATFYRYFRLDPRGRHLISACLGTACHVRGGSAIVAEIERQLGVQAGGTTPDGEFTFETVNCLGACALGPVVVIDGHYFSKVTKSQVRQLLDRAREGFNKVDVARDKRVFPVELSCPHCNHSLMDRTFDIDGYPSIKMTVSFAHTHGWLRLSCLYGSFNVLSEYDIPMDTVLNFFCPHCHAELMRTSDCPMCGAPMVPMIVRGGGMIQVCARRGCKCHRLDLV